jgi:hypothetical protein
VTRQTSIVLDTPAISAYATGTHGVGLMLARTSAAGEIAILPALCLAEAYRSATAEDALLLDHLHNLPVTVVTPVVADDCAVLGGWAGRLGRMDLAHAAMASAIGRIPIVTPDGHAVHAMLAKKWPIIDL